MITPQVTNKIELGHLIQAIMVLVVAGGGVVGSWVTLHNSISDVARDLARDQTQTVELAKQVYQTQSEQKTQARDTAERLSRIDEKLNDLRILVAGMKDGHK